MTEARQGDPYVGKEEHREVLKTLLIWTSLSPGDAVSLRVPSAQDFIGTVESRTSDGLIIWIRDNHLSERRAFHFRDCQSVRMIHRSAKGLNWKANMENLPTETSGRQLQLMNDLEAPSKWSVTPTVNRRYHAVILDLAALDLIGPTRNGAVNHCVLNEARAQPSFLFVHRHR